MKNAVLHPIDTYNKFAKLDAVDQAVILGNIIGAVAATYVTGKINGRLFTIPEAAPFSAANMVAPVEEISEETVVAFKQGLTNFQLVTKAAEKAEKAIGATGRFAGTEKHSYAFKLLERYQSIYGDRGINTNIFFDNNEIFGTGNRGFLDIWDKSNNIIYDFKFGKTGMSKAQFDKYFRNFDLPIIIIRP